VKPGTAVVVHVGVVLNTDEPACQYVVFDEDLETIFWPVQ
jgi:hypothetical protein